MTTLPDLRARVLEQARATPSPDIASTRRGNAIAIVLGVATAATMLAALGVSLGGRPMPFVALSAFGWAAIAFAATTLAGSRGGSMLGRTTRTLLIVAVAAAPAIFAWVMSCTMGWPEVREPAGQWSNHVACLVATSLLSLGPLIALTFVRRNTDPVHPRATGASIGAAAGAWGGVMIDMHCPLVHPFHIAFAHVMPVVIYAVIGALVGARIFNGPRFRG